MKNTEGSVNELNLWQNILLLVEKILVNADDDDETHLYKSVQLVQR